MDKDLLSKFELDNLKLLKSDAELALNGINHADDIITSKSDSLFRMLVTVNVGLVAFLASSFGGEINNVLIGASVILVLMFTWCAVLIYKNISPKQSAVTGSRPASFIQEKFLNDKFEMSFYATRVFALQNAIEKCEEVQSKKVENYNLVMFMVGLTITLSFLAVLVLTVCLS